MFKVFIIFMSLFIYSFSFAHSITYANRICKGPPYGVHLSTDFYCVCNSKRHNYTWDKISIILSDNKDSENYKNYLMKLNRSNKELGKNDCIIIPSYISENVYVSFLNWSSFSKQTDTKEKKLIVFDPNENAFAIYFYGKLLHWGPAIGGRDNCPEDGASCRTPEGEFKVIKREKFHLSNLYPKGCPNTEPCAKMPFYTKFKETGAGFHGSNDLPSFNASHGCIRLFKDDAQFIYNFMDIGDKVIVLPYLYPRNFKEK